MPLQVGFYIATGWVDEPDFYTTATRVENFPVQDDMLNGRRWIRPGDDADVVRPVKLVDSPSGYRFAYGGKTFSWSWRNLSPMMVDYLYVDLFDEVYSADVTVQTFNRNNGRWQIYQAIGRLPDIASEAELKAGGFDNYKINFVNARLIMDWTE